VRGRYEVTFAAKGRERVSYVLADSMASARVAALAVCAARQCVLRRIRFVGIDA
jgi:hypothetical protein